MKLDGSAGYSFCGDAFVTRWAYLQEEVEWIRPHVQSLQVRTS